MDGAEPYGFFEPPRTPWDRERWFEAQKAVEWIAPQELARAGIRAVISKTFGDYSDRRELLGLQPPLTGPESDGADPDGRFHRTGDLAQQPEPTRHEYWFDFVADVGDGFDATIAVAQQLGRPSLSKAATAEQLGTFTAGGFGHVPDSLPRGRLLVMGGDEVYPLPVSRADENSYRERTVGPYELALPHLSVGPGSDDPALHLYAVPGNHDWYDGLVAFCRQFCTGRWVGAWKTQQHRSYFAVELPFNWWLWGIDIGVEGPMDLPQLDYFKRARAALQPEDRMILCTAKPSWLECNERDDDSEHHDEAYRLLRWFMHETECSNRVRLMLSGDEHFYARYGNAESDRVKIVSGGGGASLSLTHGLTDGIMMREGTTPDAQRQYRLECAWPDGPTSRNKISPSVFKRVFPINAVTRGKWVWAFSVMVALIYLLLAYVFRLSVLDVTGHGQRLRGAIRTIGDEGWDGALGRLALDTFQYVPFWVLAVPIAIGLKVLAAGKGEKGWGAPLPYVWGLAHTAAHVGLALVITASAMVLAFSIAGDGDWAVLVFVVFVLVAGFVLGPALFFVYLFVAQWGTRNLRELAATLSEPDWKQFLRIRIDQDGLTVYALGLERVPRKRKIDWSADRAPTVSEARVSWKVIDTVTISRDG